MGLDNFLKTADGKTADSPISRFGILVVHPSFDAPQMRKIPFNVVDPTTGHSFNRFLARISIQIANNDLMRYIVRTPCVDLVGPFRPII
ncbi:hypothetical protein D3C84_973030 [compost metagenome]